MTSQPSWSHTNRELELMLEKKKPLAMFVDEVSALPDEDIVPESKFRPYVENGSIIRKEFEFALKGEEWRIQAMQLLHQQFTKTGQWNETCERIEGRLLGYSEKENDDWCRGKFSRSAL
jgi:hypothetical protein